MRTCPVYRQNTPSTDGVFHSFQDALLCQWSLHGAVWYTESGIDLTPQSPLLTWRGKGERQEADMLQEILFIATLFITRIVLPIAVTLFLGYRLERALNHNAPSA